MRSMKWMFRACIPFAAGTAVLVATACLPPLASAATKSVQKEYGKPKDDKALAYFIRTKRTLSAIVPMFVYADDKFVGVLANNCYTYAYLDPGERVLWNDWERANTRFEFEPGETYYFSAWAQIDYLPRVSGMRLMQQVKFHCSPSDEEIQTAKGQISDNTGKTEDADSLESYFQHHGGEKRIAKWPRVELSGYSILVIEDFEVTDPKAAKRKKANLMMSAPNRVANFVQTFLAPGTFREVRREELEQPNEAALILRVELTQYKPGQGIVGGVAGLAWPARLDFTARLIDGGNSSVLATFSDERAGFWIEGFQFRSAIDFVEKVLAYELATYLERQTGAPVAAQPEESAPAQG